jgi:hypothetical protein
MMPLPLNCTVKFQETVQDGATLPHINFNWSESVNDLN